MIQLPNARESDNAMAYDNAVSAVGKICQFHRDSIDSSQVVIGFAIAIARIPVAAFDVHKFNLVLVLIGTSCVVELFAYK